MYILDLALKISSSWAGVMHLHCFQLPTAGTFFVGYSCLAGNGEFINSSRWLQSKSHTLYGQRGAWGSCSGHGEYPIFLVKKKDTLQFHKSFAFYTQMNNLGEKERDYPINAFN